MTLHEPDHRRLTFNECQPHGVYVVGAGILRNCVPVPGRWRLLVWSRWSPYVVGLELREGAKASLLICAVRDPRKHRDGESRFNGLRKLVDRVIGSHPPHHLEECVSHERSAIACPRWRKRHPGAIAAVDGVKKTFEEYFGRWLEYSMEITGLSGEWL